MEYTNKDNPQELQDLQEEMEHFKQEKERVRKIVGKIGGVPSFNTRLFNIIFVLLIIGSLLTSLVTKGTLSTLMLDLALAGIAFKIMYLMHNQSRVNHFQLWLLSSLEWRINELLKEIKKLKQKTN